MSQYIEDRLEKAKKELMDACDSIQDEYELYGKRICNKIDKLCGELEILQYQISIKKKEK